MTVPAPRYGARCGTANGTHRTHPTPGHPRIPPPSTAGQNRAERLRRTTLQPRPPTVAKPVARARGGGQHLGPSRVTADIRPTAGTKRLSTPRRGLSMARPSAGCLKERRKKKLSREKNYPHYPHYPHFCTSEGLRVVADEEPRTTRTTRIAGSWMTANYPQRVLPAELPAVALTCCFAGSAGSAGSRGPS